MSILPKCFIYWQRIVHILIKDYYVCWIYAVVFSYFLILVLLPFKFLLVFCSGQFSHSVVSDSLQCHELQHVRPPCPPPTPGVYSDFMSIKLVVPSNHLILCHPLLLLPPIPLRIRVFSSESTLFISLTKGLLILFKKKSNQLSIAAFF